MFMIANKLIMFMMIDIDNEDDDNGDYVDLDAYDCEQTDNVYYD